MTTGDGFEGFVKDTRPSLAKALGDRGVQVHIVDVFDGTGHRLDGIPLALKAVPNGVRVKAAADALRFLTGPMCGMDHEYLYGTGDGAAERELETKVQLLAVALCEPAAPHDLVCSSADDLRALLDATELQQIFEVYVDWLATRNPITQAKSLEEVEAVLSALGKGMIPPFRLTSFDSSTLRSALHSLAVQRETRTSSNSSPSSPSTAPAATPPSDD